MENKQIIAEIEEYSKDITRLLVQIACDNNAIIEQARNLTLSDFNAWQTTRLHRLRKVIENTGETKKPETKEITS